jgi:hypothetical protein
VKQLALEIITTTNPTNLFIRFRKVKNANIFSNLYIHFRKVKNANIIWAPYKYYDQKNGSKHNLRWKTQAIHCIRALPLMANSNLMLVDSSLG